MMKRIGVIAIVIAVALFAGLTFTADGQDKKGAKAPAPDLTFLVYKDNTGKFEYTIMDDSGTNLGVAVKGYDKKEDLLKVIETIKNGAGTAKVMEVMVTKDTKKK
jgi:uncharacterized protein YegP (UPF0339 family)